jgi:hypothetical protein
MKKFLQRYYEQLHFNSMPEGVETHFYEWVKAGTLTSAMKEWADKYLRHEPDGSLTVINGQYIPKNLPQTHSSATDLSEDAAKKLFIAFHKAFSGMHADLAKIRKAYPKAADFVEAYFGADKLFKPATATTECKNGIAQIVNLLTVTQPELQQYIADNATNSKGETLFKNSGELASFLKDCKNGKYDTDNSTREKIIAVAKFLNNITYNPSHIFYEQVDNIKGAINAVRSPDAFALSESAINRYDLMEFRDAWASKQFDPHQSDIDKYSHPGLLQTLYHDKKIRAQFSKYDDGAITGVIDKAEETVNYQDKSKENYVDEKINDVLTPSERIQKWATNTYENSFKKYEQLRGGSVFFNEEAKYIFNAIDKAKIKPTDGLPKLLKSAGDIEKNIENPVARQHFKWFTEVMGPIAKKMPKAVEGAWKDGPKMKAVITRIILEASKSSDPDAVKKAKTAMEIMTAMKYGMMTSKVMDAMKQTDFNIFSDKSLSWNKNEGIQFVTSAFDKSIKAAFLGVGYAVTFVGNKIKMSGSKFRNKNNRDKSELAQAARQEDASRKADLLSENTQARARKASKEAELAAMGTAYTAPGELDNRKNDRDNENAAMQAAQNNMNNHKSGYDAYNAADNLINKHNDLSTQKHNLIGERLNKIIEKNKQTAKLKDPATYAGMPDPVANITAQQIQAEIDKLDQELNNINEQISDVSAQLSDPRFSATALTNAHNAKTTYAGEHAAYEAAESEYNTHKTAHDDLDSKINQFEQGKKVINELNTAISEREDVLNNWPEKSGNVVLELENYWNFLQSGKTRTWRLSTKNAQKSFDKKKANKWQQYVAKHGLEL